MYSASSRLLVLRKCLVHVALLLCAPNSFRKRIRSIMFGNLAELEKVNRSKNFTIWRR